MMGLNRLI